MSGLSLCFYVESFYSVLRRGKRGFGDDNAAPLHGFLDLFHNVGLFSFRSGGFALHAVILFPYGNGLCLRLLGVFGFHAVLVLVVMRFFDNLFLNDSFRLFVLCALCLRKLFRGGYAFRLSGKP